MSKKPILAAILALILASIACVEPIIFTPTPLPTLTATVTASPVYPTITVTPSPTIYCANCAQKIMPIETPKKQ